MKRPIRVLGYFSFAGGGIGKYTHHVFQEMALREELEPHLLTQPDYAWASEADYDVLPALFTLAHSLPLLRKARFLLAQWINPRRLIHCACSRHPDIIHLADVNHLFAGGWAAKLFDGPWRVVMTVHDVKRGVAVLNRRREERNLLSIYRRCDALFVHSRAQKAELADYASIEESKIHIVPHGPYKHPDLPMPNETNLRSEFAIPEARLTLLFFGFIKPYKGLHTALQAISMLPPELDVHLVIAGATGDRFEAYWQQCRDELEKQGLRDKTSLLIRHIPEAELATLLQLCDAVVLPYTAEFTSQSGVLNEAAAARRPLIASPAPAFVEGMESGSIGVIADDYGPEAFSRAIQRFAEGPQGYQEFDRYTTANSWQRNVNLTLDVYRQLLGNDS